jgi:D-alanyl-D-alanine carboxypeptidase
MRAWMFLAMLLLAATLARPADIPIPKSKLDAYFDALEKQGTSGGIAISARGQVRYQRYIGHSELGPIPTTSDEGTRYRIGPVSQVFTAALIMQLVESASIGLDSRLAEFFPELPNALDITYRDLLQHRSGLTNYTDLPEFERWRAKPPPRAELLAAIGAPTAPRERTERADTNYLLLGYILEKVYEKRYSDLARWKIFDKFGLSRTYYPEPGRRSQLESVSYARGADGWQPDPPLDLDLYGGAGALVSTPLDLVRFLDLLFDGKVVTPQSLATMRGNEEDPGAGLLEWQGAGRTGYGQSGHIEHHAAWVWHSPETKVSIAFTTNATTIPMETIADEVLAIIYTRGYKPRHREAGPAR